MGRKFAYVAGAIVAALSLQTAFPYWPSHLVKAIERNWATARDEIKEIKESALGSLAPKEVQLDGFRQNLTLSCQDNRIFYENPSKDGRTLRWGVAKPDGTNLVDAKFMAIECHLGKTAFAAIPETGKWCQISSDGNVEISEKTCKERVREIEGFIYEKSFYEIHINQEYKKDDIMNFSDQMRVRYNELIFNSKLTKNPYYCRKYSSLVQRFMKKSCEEYSGIKG